MSGASCEIERAEVEFEAREAPPRRAPSAGRQLDAVRGVLTGVVVGACAWALVLAGLFSLF